MALITTLKWPYLAALMANYTPTISVLMAPEVIPLALSGTLKTSVIRSIRKEVSMYIVINGGPIGGFSITGPFESPDDAIAWAESVGGLDSWWVTGLETPDIDQ
jgi:hypothetical protein